MALRSLAGPLHIAVTRWFLTHCGGSGVGVGVTGVGVETIVGTAVGFGIGGFRTPVQAVERRARASAAARCR